MAAARLGPPPGDGDEVAQVVRDHGPLLLGREREHFLVGEPREPLVLVECEHVVACPREASPDAPVRDVRVEQDAHPLLVRVDLDELGERVELAQL